MNNSSMKSVFAALCAAVVSASATAGVCKIGNTEYDTLQEAFNSKTSASADFTVTLLTDIDITSRIVVPSFNHMACTVDGAGHAIRQAYAGCMFSASQHFTHITFKNVTILGGGEACSTVDQQVYGVFFYPHSGASSLTLDSGCVVSNFVVSNSGALIGSDDNYPKWNVNVKSGAVIACNSGRIFRVAGDMKTLKISGGEIYGNSGGNGSIAFLDALGATERRTIPIVEISGGRIHDNATSSAVDAGGLFSCGYGPMDISVTGGEIFDNTGTVFYQYRSAAGKEYVSRVHFSGGMVYGNSGFAVRDNQSEAAALPSMYLSGDAVVAGNRSNGGMQGLYVGYEYRTPARTVLEGDFTGFAYLSGDQSSSQRGIGKVYGTNLLSYAGAENIHQGGSAIRVLVTDSETGELKWQEPKSAKIGSTPYDTFAAALAAATDGATIELMRDCLLTAAIIPPANKAITVNGSGYRIFRRGNIHLVDASAAGGNMTFTNVKLNEGFFTCLDSYTNHVDGVLVNTYDGVAVTVTLGPGTILSGGRGTNALVRVANGATVNLDGCVVTGAVNRAIAASAGGMLGVKGATIVKDNVGGDIDVENGNILSMNGNLTGCVHVTVAGVEACEGQKFGTKTGDWIGEENFVNGGSDPKLHVSTGGILAWCRRGFAITFR